MSDNNNNNKIKQQKNHYFRLFSFLAITVLSISTITSLFLVLQHIEESDNSNRFLANQETLLKNQAYLKNISEFLHDHELAEIAELQKRTEISANNSDKLDRIIEMLGP